MEFKQLYTHIRSSKGLSYKEDLKVIAEATNRSEDSVKGWIIGTPERAIHKNTLKYLNL